MRQPNLPNKTSAFTLFEVMLVLAIMGFMISIVSLNFSGASQKELLEKEARRFAAVFSLATEYALMNSAELGLEIRDDKSYRFLLLSDDDQWLLIEDDAALTERELPEEFSLSLELEDLPWQEQTSLFKEDAFGTEEFTLDEKDEKPPFPQVFVLSSGDITPFVLSFDYKPEFSSDKPERIMVLGEYAKPVKVLFEGEDAS